MFTNTFINQNTFSLFMYALLALLFKTNKILICEKMDLHDFDEGEMLVCKKKKKDGFEQKKQKE